MPVMRKFEVIIVGSGFAGSIMAMILRRLGRSVAILEKNRHPRFAIGESSTPLTNLLLEELAAKYDLPDLASFSKWGSWQAAHPEIACGLKRGFTFYKHEWNRAVDFGDRSQQLLVAASPNDHIADTHWYRPDFDAHLARKAAELGAELFEECEFELRQTKSGWQVTGDVDLEASFLIDASGPRGCLFRHFGLPEENSWPATETLFAHFEGVERMNPLTETPPYPVDDAAVHHVFEGGWIWVLRFNNGITSAGVAAWPGFDLHEGEAAWRRLLARLPTVKAQFANARPTTPFFYQQRLSFKSPHQIATGPTWAMLPSAIGFVDPLFSTGFVLTLLGVSRLAELFACNQLSEKNLRAYENRSRQELGAAATLVHCAYEKFGDFARFSQIARIYFIAAIWSETIRRLGKGSPSFLLADIDFVSRAQASPDSLNAYDLVGLLHPARRNWHPALANDLFANAWRIPASRPEIEAMLRKCGFAS
jgi:FADH2 O2-dependent halogenase